MKANPEIAASIVSIVSTITGVVLGFILAPLTDRRTRRRSFHDQIIVMIAELEDANDEWADYYGRRRTVLVECAKIKNDIAFWKRSRFNAACVAFCDLGNHERGLSVQWVVHTLFPTHEKPPSNDKRSPKQKMIEALQELKDCAVTRLLLPFYR